MSWDDAKSMAELRDAVDTFDRARVATLSGELIHAIAGRGEPWPLPEAKSILLMLRRKRHFALMRDVAKAFIAAGQDAPRIRRDRAQALIDNGEIREAIGVLNVLVADMAKRRTASPGDATVVFDHDEARGLVGRAYKQLYVESEHGDLAAGSYAIAAVNAYNTVYQENPRANLWHGINAVACTLRAQRDGLPVPGAPDPLPIAERIVARVQEKEAAPADAPDAEKADAWDFATAMEASIALDRADDAIAWLGKYLSRVPPDAFEFASTLRQLRQVWQLEQTKAPGAIILPTLESALMREAGGAVELSPSQLQSAAAGAGVPKKDGYEKVFGTDTYERYDWWVLGLQRGNAVGQVRTEGGEGVGTGFLVRGRDLHPSLGDEVLFMTNAHVISADRNVHNALPTKPLYPEEARVVFETDPNATMYSVTEIVWTSAPNTLDATLVRLDPAPAIEPPTVWFRQLPVGGADRVYIIGHPKGGKLCYSFQDNLLLDFESPFVHYRTPTEGGSSGSPVFDRQWRVVALHHAGYGERARLRGQAGVYAANEGNWMTAIRERMQKDIAVGTGTATTATTE
jgi:V8-like Glu-specific endopeptidase